MVSLASLLKIYFELFFILNQKTNLTRNFIVTCRSKVAKIILTGNQRWAPSWSIEVLVFNRKVNWLETCLVIRWAIQGHLGPLVIYYDFNLLCYFYKSFIWINMNPLSPAITKTRLFKYIENFTTKNLKFSDKNSDIFSYFCSEHRLWVLVRTASLRRF